MPTSIRSRVNGNEAEVLRMLHTFRPDYVCEQVIKPSCTPEALQRWLNKQPGYENVSIYGLKPTFRHPPGEISAKDIAIEIQNCFEGYNHRISALDAEVKQKDETINYLMRQLKKRNGTSAEDIISSLKSITNPIEGMRERCGTGLSMARQAL